MSQNMTLDLSALTPDQLAVLQTLLNTTPAPSPKANGKQVAPAKPAGPTTGFNGKSLSDMQEAFDANPAAMPAIMAELQARVARAGKSASNAQKALDRIAAGGPISAPKGTSDNARAKTPAEKVAEHTALYNDHAAKLLGERAEVQALEATLATVPDAAKPAIEKLLESARNRVERRNGYLAIQAKHITDNGGTVPGTAARAPRTRRNTRKAAA